LSPFHDVKYYRLFMSVPFLSLGFAFFALFSLYAELLILYYR
jgi:hypothetical protein